MWSWSFPKNHSWCGPRAGSIHIGNFLFSVIACFPVFGHMELVDMVFFIWEFSSEFNFWNSLINFPVKRSCMDISGNKFWKKDHIMWTVWSTYFWWRVHVWTVSQSNSRKTLHIWTLSQSISVYFTHRGEVIILSSESMLVFTGGGSLAGGVGWLLDGNTSGWTYWAVLAKIWFVCLWI